MTKTLEQLHQETWPEYSFDEFLYLVAHTAYPIGIYLIEDPYDTWKEQLLEMKADSGGDWNIALDRQEDAWVTNFRHQFKLNAYPSF